MTGTPAATAALMLFSRPSGLAIETTRPSVPAATALSISVACLPDVGVALVVQVDALVLAGLLRAGLDDVPERVARVRRG